MVLGPFDLAGSELYERGLVVAQSLSSIAVVRIVDAQRGERVLDLCAAPGGKTAGLAASGAAVTAVESNPARAASLRTTLERLGAADVEVIEGDGRAYRGGPFDAILVDAPCSGLGVLNGRPDSRWRRTPADVEALAVLQTELLAHAREQLAPGGRLIYAACTLSPDENERVPRAVGLTPASERRLWPGPGADGFYVRDASRLRIVSWPTDRLVLPSILASDFGAFRAQVQELLDAGARAFHCDVMDGHFVPPITFGPAVVAAIADQVHERRRRARRAPDDRAPRASARRFRARGRRLVHRARRDVPEPAPRARGDPRARHAGGRDAEPRRRRWRRSAPRSATRTTCCACPSIPAGAGRSSSRSRSRGCGSAADCCCRSMGLEVDGGVGAENARDTVDAGANLVVAGSAIYGQPSPGDAYRAIVAAAGFA